MNCNATLTTATVERLHFYCDADHDPAKGDRTRCSGYEHIDMTVLTCEVTDPTAVLHGINLRDDDEVRWSDSTPGATPHADPRERARSMTVDMLEEAATPHRGDVERCTICGGSGASKDGDCPRCEGTGREPDPCPDCGGEGRVDVGGAFSRGWTNQCPSCGGSGTAVTDGHLDPRCFKGDHSKCGGYCRPPGEACGEPCSCACHAAPTVTDDPDRGCLTMDGRHCWARNHEGCSECCWCPSTALTVPDGGVTDDAGSWPGTPCPGCANRWDTTLTHTCPEAAARARKEQT